MNEQGMVPERADYVPSETCTIQANIKRRVSGVALSVEQYDYK